MRSSAVIRRTLTQALPASIALLLIVAEPAAQPRGSAPAADPPDLSQASALILDMTNAFRRQHNLAQVKANANLAQAARYFAEFMARTRRYGHAADGHEPAARAQKFGYEYCIVAENIAYLYSSSGFTTGELARRFFEGWQNSAGHRKNMLDPNVTEAAVQIAQGGLGRFYAVQMFGRPKTESIRFSVENRSGLAVEYSVADQTFPLPPRGTRTHQRCTSADIAFGGSSLRPADGQRLVVVNDRGRLQLQVQ